MLKRLTRTLSACAMLGVPFTTVSSAPAASVTSMNAAVVCIKTFGQGGRCVIVCDDGTAYSC